MIILVAAFSEGTVNEHYKYRAYTLDGVDIVFAKRTSRISSAGWTVFKNSRNKEERRESPCPCRGGA
jgi:hypothetical protein